MHRLRPSLVVVFLALVVALSGCQGTAPTVAAAPASRTVEAEAKSPGNPQRVELARELVELETKAVALATQRVESVRELFQAGRAAETEVLAAELDLLEWRRKLLLARQELQAAEERG